MSKKKRKESSSEVQQNAEIVALKQLKKQPRFAKLEAKSIALKDKVSVNLDGY